MFKRFSIPLFSAVLVLAFTFAFKLHVKHKLSLEKTQSFQKTYSDDDHDKNPFSKRKFRKKAISEVALVTFKSNNILNFVFKPYIFHNVVNVGSENFEPIRFKRGPPQC